MSHEIRTPLSAIIGFSELLQNGNQSQDENLAAINTITRSGKHLFHLINEILDVSKIEAKKIVIEKIEVPLFTILKDIEEIIRAQAGSKQLYFRVDYHFPLPVTIHSDPVRLRQILINICNNAVKFTSEGGVTLGVSCNRKSEHVVFEVKDTGIGIAQKKIAQLFHPFSQADTSTTREYGGTGLGLYLSRQLVEIMGGKLTLDSVEAVGSTFTIRLPAGSMDTVEMLQSVSDIQVSPQPKTSPKITRLDGLRFLLAEDNRDNQRLISLYLTGAGAEVVIAENGEEAINIVRQQDFDMVLMDMQMPVMGGIEAVALMRSAGFVLPVIALTANATSQARDECLGVGCSDFITKPIEVDGLFRAISRHIQLPEPEINHGVVRSVLDSEQGRRVVQKFISGLPATRLDIEAALGEQDTVRLKDIFHQLKGVGGGVGFPMITQLAKEIEVPLASQDYAGIKNKVAEFNTLCDHIAQET